MRNMTKLFGAATILAGLGLMVGCGGLEDTRCDAIKAKVESCRPGAEVGDLTCNPDALEYAEVFFNASCDALNSGKADWINGPINGCDEPCFVHGQGIGGMFCYPVIDLSTKAHLQCCQYNDEYRMRLSSWWTLGTSQRTCPADSEVKEEANGDYYPVQDTPEECKYPQCQTTSLEIKQKCSNMGYTCVGSSYDPSPATPEEPAAPSVPWACQYPQCQTQPVTVRQQCEAAGHTCAVNTVKTPEPSQSYSPSCNTDQWGPACKQAAECKQWAAACGHPGLYICAPNGKCGW